MAGKSGSAIYDSCMYGRMNDDYMEHHATVAIGIFGSGGKEMIDILA